MLIVNAREMPEADKAEVLGLLRRVADSKPSWREDYAVAIQKLLKWGVLNAEQITRLVASVREPMRWGRSVPAA